jgi:hypothetical protein
MGDDTPVAVLSERPQLLYNYFRQLFAQVTNPPIDAIREELVTSSTMLLGSEGDLLNPRPEDCRRIRIPSPLLTNAELARLRALHESGFRAATLPLLWSPGGDGAALAAAIDGLCAAADAAVAGGANLLILSDRGVCARPPPFPALLAVAGLHQHLIAGARARGSASSSSRASRAKSTTLPASSATGLTPLTPTWPSRRSTT